MPLKEQPQGFIIERDNGMTTLKEVIECLESGNLTGATDRYVVEVGEVTENIFKDVNDNELNAAVAVVQSAAISMCMADGDLSGKDLKFMMSNTFNKVASIIFQMSVGIAAVEEMR
jgi:hypothetical protein